MLCITGLQNIVLPDIYYIPSDCKDKEIRKREFVTKIQFL